MQCADVGGQNLFPLFFAVVRKQPHKRLNLAESAVKGKFSSDHD
jgi:hypothetical protein